VSVVVGCGTAHENIARTAASRLRWTADWSTGARPCADRRLAEIGDCHARISTDQDSGRPINENERLQRQIDDLTALAVTGPALPHQSSRGRLQIRPRPIARRDDRRGCGLDHGRRSNSPSCRPPLTCALVRQEEQIRSSEARRAHGSGRESADQGRRDGEDASAPMSGWKSSTINPGDAHTVISATIAARAAGSIGSWSFIQLPLPLPVHLSILVGTAARGQGCSDARLQTSGMPCWKPIPALTCPPRPPGVPG
jgi:hypothetical protein